jgi:hypothetical protein
MREASQVVMPLQAFKESLDAEKPARKYERKKQTMQQRDAPDKTIFAGEMADAQKRLGELEVAELKQCLAREKKYTYVDHCGEGRKTVDKVIDEFDKYLNDAEDRVYV